MLPYSVMQSSLVSYNVTQYLIMWSSQSRSEIPCHIISSIRWRKQLQEYTMKSKTTVILCNIMQCDMI